MKTLQNKFDRRSLFCEFFNVEIDPNESFDKQPQYSVRFKEPIEKSHPSDLQLTRETSKSGRSSNHISPKNINRLKEVKFYQKPSITTKKLDKMANSAKFVNGLLFDGRKPKYLFQMKTSRNESVLHQGTHENLIQKKKKSPSQDKVFRQSIMFIYKQNQQIHSIQTKTKSIQEYIKQSPKKQSRQHRLSSARLSSCNINQGLKLMSDEDQTPISSSFMNRDISSRMFTQKNANFPTNEPIQINQQSFMQTRLRSSENINRNSQAVTPQRNIKSGQHFSRYLLKNLKKYKDLFNVSNNESQIYQKSTNNLKQTQQISFFEHSREQQTMLKSYAHPLQPSTKEISCLDKSDQTERKFRIRKSGTRNKKINMLQTKWSKNYPVETIDVMFKQKQMLQGVSLHKNEMMNYDKHYQYQNKSLL